MLYHKFLLAGDLNMRLSLELLNKVRNPEAASLSTSSSTSGLPSSSQGMKAAIDHSGLIYRHKNWMDFLSRRFIKNRWMSSVHIFMLRPYCYSYLKGQKVRLAIPLLFDVYLFVVFFRNPELYDHLQSHKKIWLEIFHTSHCNSILNSSTRRRCNELMII